MKKKNNPKSDDYKFENHWDTSVSTQLIVIIILMANRNNKNLLKTFWIDLKS